MYVYRNSDLPPDPHFPANLKDLGYSITENDLIRQTRNPEEGFRYRINRNDRFNVKQREAMNGMPSLITPFMGRNLTEASYTECIRQIVVHRLEEAGLETLCLPLKDSPGEISIPSSDPHVPILVSKNLASASRIILVFGEPTQDLGIWAYRSVGQDGINFGSAVNFTKAVLGERTNRTGTALILANTGQLLWHHATSRAVSQQTWMAADRPAGNWGPATMTYRNKISGNKTWSEHIEYVFEHVLFPLLGEKSRVDVIGMAEGGQGALEYLQKRWPVWKPYISGICLADPLQSTSVDLDMSGLTDPTSFVAFLASRCRAYVLSQDELGTRQSLYQNYGCNCYASGERLNCECIIPHAWPNMLDWLDLLYKDRSYVEPVVIMPEVLDETTCQELDEIAVKSDDVDGIDDQKDEDVNEETAAVDQELEKEEN
ncbi:hypothetical protein N7462_002478 [Penicillium macrosclerotiorum]|uniref:uncharacterized protein n=1 Tax=Penicillium macrosclerotiorum TaxID=303699 RepID=UPI0025499CE7|nr:uncharacterized protein N7462_002478 [Penicillium macrosclerotiorum]KAJ5693055.1 hypothetical protein N7462_002478 [Penicillium macrosclerotiorum]